MNQSAEIHELKAAMRDARTAQDPRMFERVQAVKLVLEGESRKETGRIIGRCEHTVGKYVSAYKENGLDGLRPGTSSGRPPKLTEAQRQELKEIVAYKIPADVGFPARANWTLNLVVQLIEKKWGESYTLKGASQLLDALGLSYTRPTYTLRKADPAKQEAFKNETFPELKKN